MLGYQWRKAMLTGVNEKYVRLYAINFKNHDVSMLSYFLFCFYFCFINYKFFLCIHLLLLSSQTFISFVKVTLRSMKIRHWTHASYVEVLKCNLSYFFSLELGCPRNSADTEFRGILWLLKWFLRNSGEIPRNSAEFRGISPELHRKSLPYSAECQNVTSVDTLPGTLF